MTKLSESSFSMALPDYRRHDIHPTLIDDREKFKKTMNIPNVTAEEMSPEMETIRRVTGKSVDETLEIDNNSSGLLSVSVDKDLTSAGSFCTEVRGLNLNGTSSDLDDDDADRPSDVEEDSEEDVDDEDLDAIPLLEFQSASESTIDNSDCDTRANPTKLRRHDAYGPSKLTERPMSPHFKELRDARGRYSIGKTLALTADLTPEEVAKRLEEFEDTTDSHENGHWGLPPLQRFKRAATQVRMLCAVQISLDKAIREAGRSAFGGGLPDLVANMSNAPSVIFTSDNNERVTFNPTEFKCKYEFTWPKKARQAVEKRPEDRTRDDIRLISGLMRGLHSFRKYSKVLQDLICRVVRLQKYGRRRVVVRKGHIGYSFYFVFSGAACVTLDEDEEAAFVKKEVTILKKGSSFGEIALLKDVRRKATIVCLEDTELLVVDKDDFFDNGLDRHIHEEFEYKLDFFRKLNLFSTWEEHQIEEMSDMGRIEDYNHDSLIVKDSTENEWILFVAKGRCDVLKFVDLAKLCLAEDEEADEDKNGRRSTRGLRDDTQSSILTGDYPLSLLPSGHQSPFPWMTPQRLTARPKTTGQIARKSTDASAEHKAILNNRSKSANVRLRVEEPDFSEQRDTPSPISTLSRSFAASPTPAHHHRSISEPGLPLELKSELSNGMLTMKAPGVEAGVYVKVDSLGPGQCFGLETAVNGSMPKLSLVSLGCEIIRVSMSKFREYADNATHSKATDMFTQCPTDFMLWNSFKKQNHWNNFKNGVVTDVVYDAHLLNSLTNSSGSQAGAGIVSRDISTAGSASRRKAADLVKQKNQSRISYTTNPFPKISFSAGEWVDNRASPRRTQTPSYSTRSRSLHNSAGCSRSASRSSHLARSVSSAYSVGSRRSVSRSVSPQRPVHSRLYSMPSRPMVPRIERITRPTYTGSLSWRQLRK